ncbi:alpha-amylase family glycosyl hydrolase [Chromatiaceae bacterium AAb-1]|nr:alpha-amylase family glycosyl hydrolase [Chromatiaceae bacterium AAb-1]
MKHLTFCVLLLSALLTACNPAPAPESVSAPTTTSQTETSAHWWDNAVFYQIWPRSFYDTDNDGHGDFNGITAKLPYLQQLGVNALWLTPIFEAPSYHGYDFTEFYQTESDYGSIADFENLIQQAAAKDIRIILDLVINHISDKHDWFTRSANGEAPYKDYFIWRDDLPQTGWGHAWDNNDLPEAVWHWNENRQQYYYAAFGASQPDLNLTHPDVIAEMKKMAKFWLDKGVAGFRLDAVRFAIENGPRQQADTAETIAYWQDFNQYVKSINPEAYLVGEAWVDIPVAARYYGNGQGLDQGFDFEIGYSILRQLRQQHLTEAQFGTMSEQQLSEKHPLQQNMLRRLDSEAPLSFFAPFLTNHDQDRTGWQLQQNQASMKQAAAMMFSSPGTPYLYYGEEIGMTQATTGNDVYRRAPMLWDQSSQAGFTGAETSWVEQSALFGENYQPWWPDFLSQQLQQEQTTVAAQQQQADSLWHFYQFLIKQKRERAEFSAAGSYQATEVLPGLLVIERQLRADHSVFILNLNNEMLDINTVLDRFTKLHISWIFDLDGSQLAPQGVVVLQSHH